MAHPVGSQFWRHVDRSGECWLWSGWLSRDGYGQSKAFGINGGAHRVAWRLVHGEFPPAGMTLDHLCRNRRCVNPAHLEVVTRAENVRRGLLGVLKTHCKRGHPFDEANTLIRRRSGTRAGQVHRQCKTCWNDYYRAYRAYRAKPAA